MARKHAEASGRTVEEALRAALEAVGLREDEVDVTVLDEGAKALFGLLGGRAARVEVQQRETPALVAQEFLEELTRRMGLPCDVTAAPNADGDGIAMEMRGEHVGSLIGYRGETLDALQYLTSLMVNREPGKYLRVSLDGENYRQKREEALCQLAQKMANKCYRTRRRVIMEPMNPYERRIFHSALQEHPHVTTHSEGVEPNRRIVITLKA